MAGADEDIEAVLDALPSDGGFIGNTKLMRDLGWEAQKRRYWNARNAAVDRGLVVKGGGRGGSSALVLSLEVEQPDPEEELEDIAVAYEAEKELYEPMLSVIEESWAADRSFEVVGVVDTSSSGPKGTGKWSRPDITLVAFDRLEFFPSDHFEIVTFEVKLGSTLDPTAVYEALSHRRAAHRAVLVVYLDEGADADRMEKVLDVAREHGIGWMQVEGDAGDYENWTPRGEATRVDPDPRLANSFIADQLEKIHGDIRQRLDSLKQEMIKEIGSRLTGAG